jgi:phosphohistidine phosphatase
MRLLIVRHAIAVPSGTPGIPDDERPLTDDGRKKFRRVARGLARLVRQPDAILTSPLPRARETADILAACWDGVTVENLPALAVGDHAGLEQALQGYPADAFVALVGHEPWLSTLLAHVLDARSPERFVFRKGGAAMVELRGSLAEGGLLHWFARPKVLRE